MILEEMILEDGSVILPIHYEVGGRLACQPGLKDLHASGGRGFPYLRSNDQRSVTCPNCIKTWKQS